MKEFNKYFIVGTNSDALHDTMNGSVVGELIRCKDCRWFINKECAIYCLSSAHEETFCSYAEPKEK